MKWQHSILAVVVSCLVLTHAVAAQDATWQARQEHPFELHRFTLENGLRVWCQPRPDSKSVVVFLVVRIGVRNEEKANNGISHYLEHMLFTGTERWDEDEIKEIITKRGGHWNGWTGTERTMYFAEMAAQDFDIAMDWVSEIVFHSTFPEEKIEKERNVVFQEYWGKYGWFYNTFRRVFVSLGLGYNLGRTVERFVYPDSSLTLGYEWADEALDKIDREALLAYYHTYYVPNNATLLIVGNVTPEQALETTQHYFGSLEKGESPKIPEMPEVPDDGPYHAIIRGPEATYQCRLRMGTRTVGPTHPDRWTLDVLSEMLRTSLYKEIRHKRGLVYAIWAYNHMYSDVGRFEIGTRSEGDKRELIQHIVEEHLEKIRQGEIDPQKVAEAKTALKGRWALNMEKNFGRVQWLNGWVLSLADDEPVPDYEANIDAVTPEDLTRVLKTYFVPERSYVVMHLPILTVYRGAWIAGGMLVLIGLGILYHRRQKKRKRRYHEILNKYKQQDVPEYWPWLRGVHSQRVTAPETIP